MAGPLWKELRQGARSVDLLPSTAWAHRGERGRMAPAPQCNRTPGGAGERQDGVRTEASWGRGTARGLCVRPAPRDLRVPGKGSGAVVPIGAVRGGRGQRPGLRRPRGTGACWERESSGAAGPRAPGARGAARTVPCRGPAGAAVRFPPPSCRLSRGRCCRLARAAAARGRRVRGDAQCRSCVGGVRAPSPRAAVGPAPQWCACAMVRKLTRCCLLAGRTRCCTLAVARAR